ncbi:hypothetical protein QZH41_020705, partial [Actinostola sp. cb2023]
MRNKLQRTNESRESGGRSAMTSRVTGHNQGGPPYWARLLLYLVRRTEPKKANNLAVVGLHKRQSYYTIYSTSNMQTEETNNSTDSLENLQYANPSQVVLDGPLSEQNRVFAQAAMGELKRPLDQDEDDDDDSTGHPADIKPAKKTRGRVKIDMKFISNKLRRYTTFSKRKTGIMKKAYELSTLTGTQVMLLVASETGHVYTFATRKLQPMITSESGKALIQTCLNSPDPPVSQVPNPDQRMSATGYEETDLTYTVNENDVDKDRGGIYTTQQIDGGHQLGLANTTMTGITAMSASGHSFPITTYIPQQSTNKSSVNPSSYSVQAMPGGAFTTIFTPGSNVGGTPVQLQQAGQGTQQHA